MSQKGVRIQYSKIAKYFGLFAFVSLLVASFIAPATYAQQAPPQEPEASVLPDVCELPNPEVTVPPEPAVPGIHIVPTTLTNNANLQWSWVFTAPEPAEGEEPFVFNSYNYAIYNGDTLQFEGTLPADATTLEYAAPSDGNYRLHLWTVEIIQEATEEEAAVEDSSYCSDNTTPLDTTPPAVYYNGYLQNGSSATPLIAVDEEGLIYSWTVNRLGNGVEISDLNALNPNFTFSRDGTYNFELTATDSAGNATTVSLSIPYLVPFVPSTDEAPVIPEESIPAPIQTYTPIEEAPRIAYRAAPTPTDDGMLPPEVDASIYSSTSDGIEEASSTQKEVAGAVSAGNDGWRVLGVSWYWWVLIVAIIGTAWLWLVRTYRSRFEPDDV